MMSYLCDAVSHEGDLGRILCQSDASKDEKEGEKISWIRATVSPKPDPRESPALSVDGRLSFPIQ